MLSQLNRTYISEELEKKLTHISDCAVTTIVAPMGYGKTKAVDWWVSRQEDMQEVRILLQIITTDSLNDFWQGLCRNLRDSQVLYEELTALGFPTEIRACELLLQILRDALEADGRQVFYILDDLHLVSSPKLSELLTFLCTRMPKKLHLVLISRNNIFSLQSDFKLGSSRYGINAEDLRLTETGLSAYTRQCGLKLKKEQIKALITQTEGWFAIIYLNLRSFLRDGHWLDSTESVYSVVDEVLFRPLPERQAAFLVCMGLPDSFTREEALWLWGKEDAGELLDILTGQNAFINEKWRDLPVSQHAAGLCQRQI